MKHSDKAEDEKLIAEKLKAKGLKKGGKVKMACGGKVKARKKGGKC